MLSNKGKKLFVIGMEEKLEGLIQQQWGIHSHNMITLRTFGPEITLPYGSLMRDIIINVYEESIEEVFVVGVQEGDRAVLDAKHIETKLFKQQGMDNKVTALNYILKNSMIGFPYDTVTDWLCASLPVAHRIERSIKILCQHPLMPDCVKVQGLIWSEDKAFCKIDHSV